MKVVRHWEFNGNLDDEDAGVPNFNLFMAAVTCVKLEFDKLFGLDTMNKIPLLIDNATKGSGYTPICTPVLNSYVCIKLGIKDGAYQSQVIYQFAHELTHFVFFSLCGLQKELAGTLEEAVCSAGSLVFVKMFFPQDLERFKASLSGSKHLGYQQGARLAEAIKYDPDVFKNLVLQTAKSLDPSGRT